MLLHQQLNNEALDEDYKQQTRVVQMIKRNELIEENKDLKPDINQGEFNSFNSALSYLNKQIEGDLEDIEGPIEENEIMTMGTVPFAYDKLMMVIKSLKLNDKSNKDTKKIYDILDEILVPKLKELQYKATQYELYDAYLVPFMINNIKSRRFDLILTDKNLQKRYIEEQRDKTDYDLYGNIPTLEDEEEQPLEDEEGNLLYPDLYYD